MTHPDELFRLLVEQVRDYAIFAIGPDGRTTTWNEGVRNVLGYEEAEFIGLEAAVLFPPEDRAAGVPDRELADAAARGSASDDRWMLRNDGSRVWAVGRTSSVRNAAGELIGFAKVMRDRTDLKQMDGRLRATADRYRILLESASDVVVTISRDSTILFANAAVERVFGYAPEEVLGRSLTMLMPEQYRQRHGAGMERYLSTGVRRLDWHRVELPGRHKSGHEVRLEVAFGESLGHEHTFTGIIRDVTERYQAERELRQAELAVRATEARFRAAVEAVSDMLWTNNAAGEMSGDQPQWAAFTGQSREEYQGFGWARAVHPDDAQPTIDAWNENVRRRGVFAFEHRVRRHDGVYRRFAIRAVPVVDDDGTLREWVGVHTDITDQTRLEQQVRQAERLQAVGTLAGGVAHEVNNQMTAVLGFGQFVLEALGSGHPQSDDVSEMLKSARRAAQITQQLLTFSRRQVTQPEVLDVHQLAGELRPVLERILGSDRTLAIPAPQTCYQVRADRTQIEQVLINLVANASDATASAGTVSIVIDDVHLDSSYAQHRGVQITDGPFVRIVVSDNGIGMDRETLERIFEPFFTTKPFGSGTGLGLSTVYGIVKQHEGFIWAYSEPGLGTAMKIYLPAVRAGAGLATAPEVRRPKDANGTTILLVEDEDSVRTTARRALESAGYAVLESEDGARALELMRAEPHRIGLVVTDVVMAGLNGGRLGQALRASHPSVPVLYMSGYPGDDIQRRGMLPEGAAFLQKPFGPDELTTMVRELLGSADPRIAS